MRKARWLDWLISGCLGTLAALLLLWPRGLNPEDLELTIHAKEIPAEGWHQQNIEVIVRWRWLKPPRPEPFGRPADRLVIGYDHHRWVLRQPESWQGSDQDRAVLSRLGQLRAGWSQPVTPGTDGEFRMVIMAQELGEHYRAEALPIQIHYVHGLSWWHGGPDRGWFSFVPAGREWVKTAAGPFALP